MLLKNQRGVAHVGLVLLIVLVFAVIGLIGWRVLSSSDVMSETNSTQTSAPASQNELDDMTADKQRYTDEVGKFTLDYPHNWKIDTKKEMQVDKPTTFFTLSSPAGTKIKGYAYYGGRGGMCESRPADKPFRQGNECATFEYLSKTNLPIEVENSYLEEDPGGSDNLVSRTKMMPVYLVRFRHHDGASEQSTYGSCLESERVEFAIKLNDPQMGALWPFTEVYDSKTGLHIKACVDAGNSETDFESLEIKEAEAILSSFRFE